MNAENERPPLPAIRREKLIIERIGLGGLIALWSMAVVVAIEIPYLCSWALFRSRTVGVIAGLAFGGLVAARATFRIRANLAQLRKRHGL